MNSIIYLKYRNIKKLFKVLYFIYFILYMYFISSPAALPQTAHIVASAITSYISDISCRVFVSKDKTSKCNWHIVPTRQKSVSFPGSKLQVTTKRVWKDILFLVTVNQMNSQISNRNFTIILLTLRPL